MRKFVKYPQSYIAAAQSSVTLPAEVAQLIAAEFERTDLGYAVDNTICTILDSLPGVTGIDEELTSRSYVGVSFLGGEQRLFNWIFTAYQKYSGMKINKYTARRFGIQDSNAAEYHDPEVIIEVRRDRDGNTYTDKDKAFAVFIDYAQ